MTKTLSSLNFFSEDVDFQEDGVNDLSDWLKSSVANEGFDIQQVNFIFCSDEYLLEINRKHLDHDYYTDIITFDLSDRPKIIESDIFISIERIGDNAESNNLRFVDEYHRVLIHGLLHLMGYNDKTEDEKSIMRKAENKYLALRPQIT